MRLIIFTVIFILVIASISVAMDPPHTSDLNVTCANCHNPSVTFTYATIDNTPWNEVCWSCHDFGASGSNFESDTHSAISTGDDVNQKYWGGAWTNECRRCHDPHTNEQARVYMDFYPAGAWLYTGTIQASTYNTITVSGNPWNDGDWVGKTLQPQATGSFLYRITNSTPNTLVVAGTMWPFIRMPGGTFAISYGKLIRAEVTTRSNTDKFRTVKFLNSSGASSFADGNGAYDGVCEVCHSLPSHFRRDGSGSDQLHANIGGGAGRNCMQCHAHTSGFGHGPGGEGCGTSTSCHGTTGSHQTHVNASSGRGLSVDCSTCHDTSSFPTFKDEKNLAGTSACDACHSPAGSYDGVNDIIIGAKNNWSTGVYDDNALKAGKEKWCATCHDGAPSVISSVSAPAVIGDETEPYTYGIGWGYYKTGHGLPISQTYPASGGIMPGAGQTCAGCHDFGEIHIDGDDQTYDAAAVDGANNDYQHGYRLKSIDGQPPMDIPRIDGCESGVMDSDFRLCFSCHDNGPFISPDNYETNFKHTGAPDFNAHYSHLAIQDGCGPGPEADTDWDGIVESRVTCVTCHNVHGSPQLAMIRSGELVGREPGLRIVYYNAGVSFVCSGPSPHDPLPPDKTLTESTGAVYDPNVYNLCGACHGSCGWDTVYSRTPEDYWEPKISAVFGAVGSANVAVRFNEGVYSNPGPSGNLVPGDFSLIDVDNGRNISSVSHTGGDTFAYLTLSSPLDGTDDVNVDTVAAATAASIYDSAGNGMATTAVPIKGDGMPPSISDAVPGDGATGLTVTTKVTFTLTDTDGGIDWTTFSIQLAGDKGYLQDYSDLDTTVVSKTGSPARYDVTVNPDTDFGYDETITVTVNASDVFGNAMSTEIWSFTTIDASTPQTLTLHPSGVDIAYAFTTFPADSWSTALDSSDGLNSYANKCSGAGYPTDPTSHFSVNMDDWTTTGEPSPSTIQSIAIGVVVKYAPSCPTSGTSTGTMGICYKTGTNRVCTDHTISGDFSLYTSPNYSSDSDGGVLDLTDIDNIQLEIQRKSGGSIHLIVTEVYLDVTYIP